MKRRQLLSTVGGGLAVGTAGCIGGGGDVVTTVQHSVSVRPGQGWVKRIPDVSDPGGSIQYRAKAPRPFDVYFFTSAEQYMYYDTYTDGGEPAQTPAGHDGVSARAERAGDEYRAATGSGGSRERVSATGPYFFVVDHSGYRGETVPNERAEPMSVFVDLTVTELQFGI